MARFQAFLKEGIGDQRQLQQTLILSKRSCSQFDSGLAGEPAGGIGTVRDCLLHQTSSLVAALARHPRFNLHTVIIGQVLKQKTADPAQCQFVTLESFSGSGPVFPHSQNGSAHHCQAAVLPEVSVCVPFRGPRIRRPKEKGWVKFTKAPIFPAVVEAAPGESIQSWISS